MTDIHLHWRATDTEEVPVHGAALPIPKLQTRTISRKPAAIAGIAMATTCGFLFFGGVNHLRGQLASATTIEITDTGIVPPIVTVGVGDTITFKNSSTVPRSLTSETLCSEIGYCLASETLQPGETENFSITQEFVAGTYDYSSTEDPSIRGQVIIGSTQTPEPQNAPEFRTLDSLREDSIAGTGPFAMPTAPAFPSSPSLSETLEMNGQEAVAPESTSIALAPIPQNPYAIGSSAQHPSISEETVTALHSGAPLQERPLRQPETGPGLWLVVLLSLGGILAFAHKSLRTQQIEF